VSEKIGQLKRSTPDKKKTPNSKKVALKMDLSMLISPIKLFTSLYYLMPNQILGENEETIHRAKDEKRSKATLFEWRN
jgi:hypothetical protein